jgi:hypothetical protein
MATAEQHRPSKKSMRAPPPPSQCPTISLLHSTIPINPSPSNPKPIIKDLRQVNLLNELYPLKDNKTHIQESVEILPQSDSYERIFYSYIDDHTDIRTREYIKLDQGVYMRSNDSRHIYENNNIMKFFHNIEYDQRFKLDFYSTTLYIFPKQRNEKFISEIRYIPEHISIKYKTTFEILSTTNENYYQNIYQIANDIFYRI